MNIIKYEDLRTGLTLFFQINLFFLFLCFINFFFYCHVEVLQHFS